MKQFQVTAALSNKSKALYFFRKSFLVNAMNSMVDRIILFHNGSRRFMVRSLYKVLIVQTHNPFPWKRNRKCKVSPKVAFFVWTAALDKILTIDNLRKHGLIVLIGVTCIRKMGNLWILYY